MVVLTLGLLFGCSGNGSDRNEATEAAEAAEAEAETKAQEEPGRSSETEAFELSWSVQPKPGLIKGDYYRAEERFRQGHLGIFELVTQDDAIVYVEFNEISRANYYNRYYQNVPKRMSEYNFDMGRKKGAAWIQSVVLVEEQMLEQQRITGDFDVVSGASNSIYQSMLPLAEKISQVMEQDSNQRFYSYAEKLGGGLTGFLKVVLTDGKISSVQYDEIFADSPSEIENEGWKKHYRQSKYQSVEYDEPSRIGFNFQMDRLNEKVIRTQDLLDISELPSIDESGDYASSGFTIRNDAWDNYLRFAGIVLEAIQEDGYLE